MFTNTFANMSARTIRIAPRRLRLTTARPLSTNSKTKTDLYPDDKRTVDKVEEGDTYNIRESDTKDAME